MKICISIFILFITLSEVRIGVAQNPTECKQMMRNWLLHPQNLPEKVYMNSGKFINDLGDYNNCLYNRQQYTYFTMRFINRILNGLQYVGLCAPNYCKQQIADNQFAVAVQDYLNELYMNKTGQKTGIFIQTTFYSPVDNKPQMDWSNYIVVALVLFLITLGILGSALPKSKAQQSFAIKFLKCFSFKDNFDKIITISRTNQNENLLFLNGMRVLSIFWIIFGHDMWFRFFNIKNWMETFSILATPGIPTLVPAAYFAVDTFFWIGGFLVTIGLLEHIVKAKSFPKFYLFSVVHRFIRIWPTYMMAILIYWKIAPYIGSGPIWNTFQILANQCSNKGILWNMFFIDNFGDHGLSGMKYCFGWGWYLAVDFQFFLVTPLLIYVYVKNKKIGWIVSLILFFASIICAFVLIVVNDWRYPIPNPKFKPQPNFMDNFYYRPYVRASTYLMGVFSGFIYSQWKQGQDRTVRIVNYIKNSIPIRILLYVVGIFLCEFTIWIILPFQKGQAWSTTAQAFYNSLNRVFFILGVYCCVFAAMFGCQNDPVKYILGHRMFSPLAKVSFCVYLTHLIVIMRGTFSGRMDLYWEPYSAVYIVISDIFWSIVAATFLSLLIEAPTLGLEKLLMKKDKKSNKGDGKQKSEQNQMLIKQTPQVYYTRPSSMISTLSYQIERQQLDKSGQLA